MSVQKMLGIFEAYGIELEYMLVDRDTLNVRSVADEVMQAFAGVPTGDIDMGETAWSNELALHVLELKGNQPTKDLVGLTCGFQSAIRDFQHALAGSDVRLMPGGMHPWMDPRTEARLWPHEYAEIYAAYHRIFNCFTHGWSNVQSVHLNLPFNGDTEFAKLHAATRILLPLLPALTASSPIVDGGRGPWLDTRMAMVRAHCEKIPFLTGDLVPEALYDEASYRRQIFARLKEEIAPHDPDGVFDANFLNSRGAIARFDRGSIEIRVMDVQEHPLVDVAVCMGVIGALKTLVAETWQPLAEQKQVPTDLLSAVLDRVSEFGEQALINDPRLLRQFGITESVTAGEVWRHVFATSQTTEPLPAEFNQSLQDILNQGTLSSRINRALDGDYRRPKLTEVYRELCDCLLEARSFSL